MTDRQKSRVVHTFDRASRSPVVMGGGGLLLIGYAALQSWIFEAALWEVAVLVAIAWLSIGTGYFNHRNNDER